MKWLLILTSLQFILPAFAERHPIYEPSDNTIKRSNNLLLNAEVSTSGVYGNDKATYAVDGQVNPNQFWGCENLPVWLTADMKEAKPLREIKLWLYWNDGRIYKYIIEGSLDGKSWETLVDQSANSIAATKEGQTFSFEPKNLRYVKVSILDNSNGKESGGHIVELQAFSDSSDKPLLFKAASLDKHYPKNEIPQEELASEIKLQGWKGEKVNAKALAFSPKNQRQLSLQISPLKNEKGATIPLQASFMRFTKAGKNLFADIIDDQTPFQTIEENSSRPVWISSEIPTTATPGIYKGAVTLTSEGNAPISIPIELTVTANKLPLPKDWKIHLDIWQHPEAVARFHQVKSWSPEHFALMKPIMKRLADAGQKNITCSIIHEAWNEQTYDWWPSMIEWIKDDKGTMTYDYTNFDKWVKFMRDEVGITGHIIGYTMIPWSLKVRYFDKKDNTYKSMDLKPGDKSYEDIWGPFLTDFCAHLKKKGWLDKTLIGIDERPDHLVKPTLALLEKYAPQLRVTSAINTPSDITKNIYDISPVIGHTNTLTPELMAERKKNNYLTTFYVCCQPTKPNTFTASPPAEARWLGLFSAANNLDGFLRWAYNSWGVNPFETTDFGNWLPGDCFFVYPGNLSSPRFELLRDGLEDYEKIRILREKAASKSAKPELKKAVENMNKLLTETFTIERSQGKDHAEDVQKAVSAINETAKWAE